MTSGQHCQDGIRVAERRSVRVEYDATAGEQQHDDRNTHRRAALDGADHQGLQLSSPSAGVEVGYHRQHDENHRLRAEHGQPRQLARRTVQPSVARAEEGPYHQDVRLLRQDELRCRNHQEAANRPLPLGPLELGRRRDGARWSGATQQEQARAQRHGSRPGVEGHGAPRFELHAGCPDEHNAHTEQDRPQQDLR